MKNYFVLLLTLMPASEVFAEQGYTYIQSTLAFPWFMFFVFFALILIPFFMVIILSWRIPATDENGNTTAANPASSLDVAAPHKSQFNRFVLPALLIGVAIFSILLVMNAYEAMDLMEQYGTAAPTMLNARP